MFAKLNCVYKTALAMLAICGVSFMFAPTASAQSDGCTVEANSPNSSIQQAVNNGCSQKLQKDTLITTRYPYSLSIPALDHTNAVSSCIPRRR